MIDSRMTLLTFNSKCCDECSLPWEPRFLTPSRWLVSIVVLKNIKNILYYHEDIRVVPGSRGSC